MNPGFSTQNSVPLLKQEVLGDRTQGEGWQILQKRDDSDHAEEETDEEWAVCRQSSRRRQDLLLSRERSGDRKNWYCVGESPEKHRKTGRDVVPGRVGAEPGERGAVVGNR